MVAATAISSAMQDYLEVILTLSETGQCVRVTDIAAKLNIAKASVAQAVRRLKSLGMVTQEKYGPVTLTPIGMENAIKVRQRHRSLLKFLVDVLGVSPAVAEKDACLMEHVVSAQTMQRLIEFMDVYCEQEGQNGVTLPKAQSSPSGDSKGSGSMKTANVGTLNELGVGSIGKVIRVTGEGPVRRRILDMGVTPGAEVCVKGVAPLGDPIEVNVRGYRLSLRKAEAAEVYVEVIANGE